MMISQKPYPFKHSISCSKTGLPSISIIGFGISLATDDILVPLPPAIITVFIMNFSPKKNFSADIPQVNNV